MDERALVLAVQRGDRETFAALYQMYFLSLCDFACYMTRDAEVAKELVQDMFLAIWEQRQSWSPQGTVRSYLFRAVKNRSLDFLKHQKVVRNWEKQHSPPNEMAFQQDSDHVSDAELAAAIEREIDRLPQKCRLIFVMSRQQGLTYKEIAEVEGLSVKTVETQMGRALKKLRESLRDFL